MSTNYQFYIETNVDEYIGQWIAICDGQIISHGTDIKLVYKEAKQRCPHKKPLITRVPNKETMIF